MSNTEFTAAKLPRQCIKCSAMFSGKACMACRAAYYQKNKVALSERGEITAAALAEQLFISPDSPSGLRYRHALVSKLGIVMRQTGAIAGAKNRQGYYQVHVDGRQMRAHHAVFALTHGRMPVGQIDHINGDRGDNNPGNLRDVTPAYNSRNCKQQERNTSGKTGVDMLVFNGYEYWRARWYSAEGKLTNRQFSVKKLGDAGAFNAACTYRDTMTAAIGGYTARHGTAVQKTV